MEKLKPMATSQSQTVVQLLISLQVETNRQKTSRQQQRVQRQLQVWIRRDSIEIDTAVEVVMTKAIERGRCFLKGDDCFTLIPIPVQPLT